jgi:hypothetical protein
MLLAGDGPVASIEQQRGGIIITDGAGLQGVACECCTKVRQTFARFLPTTPNWTDQ